LILLSHIDGGVPKTSFCVVLDGSRVGWFFVLEAAHSSIGGADQVKNRSCTSRPEHALLPENF
jgi:hypothetical protein